MRNGFEIKGNETKIYVHKRNGKIYEVLVDTEDLSIIIDNASSIQVHDCDSVNYAKYICKKDKKSKTLHRLIMKTPEHLVVDHIDHDGLNNRKSNLRNCTTSDNGHNQRLYKFSESGIKGVSYLPYCKQYKAQINLNGVRYDLGFHETKEAAAAEVDKFRKAHMKPIKNYYGDVVKIL